VKPAQDRARELACEQVVTASRQRDDVRRRPCMSKVGKYAVGGVAVAREVDELDAKLARELRGAPPPSTPV
jgi:hypothetical protein